MPEQLPEDARRRWASRDRPLFFSLVSLWDVAIKASFGREDFQLDSPRPFRPPARGPGRRGGADAAHGRSHPAGLRRGGAPDGGLKGWAVLPQPSSCSPCIRRMVSASEMARALLVGIGWSRCGGRRRRRRGRAAGRRKGCAHHLSQLRCDGRRQVPEGATQPVAPHLLAVVQMQGLEGLLHSLMTGEAGPFVVSGAGAHRSQVEIGPGLMQPAGGAVHDAFVEGAVALSGGPEQGGVVAPP